MEEKKDSSTAHFFNQADYHNWQIVKVDFRHSLFFNPKQRILLGLGENIYKNSGQSPWTIPLRYQEIQQIAAGGRHILILYKNGLLEGYGDARSGELGIGRFENRDLQTVEITLPHGEKAHSIAAAKNYSLVLSDKGVLYGFGSNESQALGFDKKRRCIEFPSRIPLPHGIVVQKIFTGDNKTIVMTQQGIYGWGHNVDYQSYESSPPTRLSQFEKLNPSAFYLGEHATILLSPQGSYFFGHNFERRFPVENKKIILPEGLGISHLSFNQYHLMVRSTTNEIWITTIPDSNEPTWKKLDLPPEEKITDIACGFNSFAIMGNHCYAYGNSRPFDKNDLQPKTYTKVQRIPLSTITRNLHIEFYSSAHREALFPDALIALFSQQVESFYIDNTALIKTLEKAPQIIEVVRPSGFGKSLALSMLYAYYTQSSTYFTEEGRRPSPVILLDFTQLNFQSFSNFICSYEQLMAGLYLKHRQALLPLLDLLPSQDYLAYDPRDTYHRIALCSNNINYAHALKNMISYLYLLYGDREVKLLIDNAHLPITHSKDNQEITTWLCNAIDSAILGNPRVKTVFMCQQSSPFAEGYKQSHFLHTKNSPYNALFGFTRETLLPLLPNTVIYDLENEAGGYHTQDAVLINPKQTMQCILKRHYVDLFWTNHVIHQLTANAEQIALIAKLLQSDAINLIIDLPNDPFFNALLNTGLLTVKVGYAMWAVSIPNQAARKTLQDLYAKWREIQIQRRITVVFDIDGVLATHDTCSNNTRLFFSRLDSIIFPADLTHYILPGRVELLQFISKHTISIFSSGDEKRNKPFAEMLFKKAFEDRYDPCGERYKEIVSDLIILSKQHCSPNGKKDIGHAIRNPRDIIDTLFIDDNPSVVYPEHKGNYLYAESVSSCDFDKLAQNVPCNQPHDPLFRKLNAVFYWAYLFEKCLKTNRPVTEILLSLHSDKDTAEDSESVFPKMAMYERGLILLRQYNHKLDLITPAFYKACITNAAREKEAEEITKAAKQEPTTCVMM